MNSAPVLWQVFVCLESVYYLISHRRPDVFFWNGFGKCLFKEMSRLHLARMEEATARPTYRRAFSALRPWQYRV